MEGNFKRRQDQAVLISLFLIPLWVASGFARSRAGTIPEAKALVQERCTVCHGLERIEKAKLKLDRQSWVNTVSRMIEKGAKVDGTEAQVIVEYLSAPLTQD